MPGEVDMLTLAQALAWRLQRHALLPAVAHDVVDVAQRVVAFRAWPTHLASQTVNTRLAAPDHAALEEALARGDVVASYAHRGGAYVFTPAVAAALLAIRTITRVWETARYQQQGHFAIDDWEPLRDVVRDALSSGPMTRSELRARIVSVPALRHLEVGATGKGSDSLYKPLHWWGDICFGPPRDGESTFRLLHGDPRWQQYDDLDAAGHDALKLFLAAYAPASLDNLIYWFTEGLSVPRRRLQQWLHDLRDTVSSVYIDGTPCYVLTDDLAALHAEPTDSVRLLPGYDPWILGPGTADVRLLDPAHRSAVTNGANIVIRGGVICGTWRLQKHALVVTRFSATQLLSETDMADDVQRVVPNGKATLTITLTTT